jgi:hypothetical protein
MGYSCEDMITDYGYDCACACDSASDCVEARDVDGIGCACVAVVAVVQVVQVVDSSLCPSGRQQSVSQSARVVLSCACLGAGPFIGHWGAR